MFIKQKMEFHFIGNALYTRDGQEDSGEESGEDTGEDSASNVYCYDALALDLDIPEV